jgi:hypothetical protein
MREAQQAPRCPVPNSQHEVNDEDIDDDIDEKDAAEEGTFVPCSGSAP